MTDIGRLPSLNALRAFVVAGRTLNMATAAKELFVTPSALSHQIRGLEETLGVALFVRKRQGLELTDAGRQLLPGLTEAFDRIGDTLARLQPPPESNILTVSMLSTFAMRWFIPRLSHFQQLHPDIEVRISTSVALVDFAREDVDCAIRSGRGSWPGTVAVRLFAEQLTPVCSPKLLNISPIATTADLARQTLLHAKLRPDDWRVWLHAAGAGDLRPAHEQTFETRNFAIQAAIDGVGVAIIDPSLVADELQAGRLVQPFRVTLPADSAYYLVWPDWREAPPKLTAFRDWLLSEAQET
ncbi:MAG TPA: transcriptional regulator GcvA [Mariprofundaceae bacterium]|nr:transcriptional regulator GcvA [Mariprofundaceae bacterium]